MQVTTEPLENCQVALTIEVEEDKVVSAVDRAYREYAKYVNVPGFRKGKAPLHFVKQRIPDSDVKQRAAELLVEPAYDEALKETDITPYARPKLEVVQLELENKPFIFKAVVPLPPTVELGKYTGIEVEKTVYEIPETVIDEEIERRRSRAADYPKVERPVQDKDLVIAEIKAIVDARPEMAEPRRVMIEIGGDNVPGFDEQIIGLSVDEEKTFDLSFPDNYQEEDLQGQPVTYTIKILEIRERVLPEVNDELAVKITEGRLSTLEELRAEVRKEAEELMTRRSEREAEDKLVDQIVANAKVAYPPILAELEAEEDYREMLSRLERSGATLDQYLANRGITKRELSENLLKAASDRVRMGLVLGEVADTEKLDVNDEDLDKAIAEQAVKDNTNPASLRALMESRGTMDAMRNRVQTKKVLDFLMSSAIIKEKAVSILDAAEENDDIINSEEAES